MLRQVNVPIDESVVIPCPRKEFKPALAAEDCTKCEYFDGLGLMSTDLGLPWHKKYAVRCTHPIERRVQPIKFEFKDSGRIRDINITS